MAHTRKQARKMARAAFERVPRTQARRGRKQPDRSDTGDMDGLELAALQAHEIESLEYELAAVKAAALEGVPGGMAQAYTENEAEIEALRAALDEVASCSSGGDATESRSGDLSGSELVAEARRGHGGGGSSSSSTIGAESRRSGQGLTSPAARGGAGSGTRMVGGGTGYPSATAIGGHAGDTVYTTTYTAGQVYSLAPQQGMYYTTGHLMGPQPYYHHGSNARRYQGGHGGYR